MGDSIIVRIVSEAGRNRIEIDSNATVKDLKDQISDKIGVDSDKIRLYEDIAFKKLVNATDKTTLKKAKIANGVQFFIPNKDAKFTDVVHKPKKEDEEEKVSTTKPSKISSTPAITKPTAGGDQIMEDGRHPDCRHGPKGKCLHCLGVTKDNFQTVDYKCNHPPGQM